MDIVKRIALVFALVLVQALVLNNIHLYGCATPLLYILLPLHFRRDQARWTSMMWCFCTGLLLDIFANTPGVAAGAMTLIGFIQPKVLVLFLDKESAEDFEPTLKGLGWLKFFTYTLILTVIYSFTFFTLESFSFFNLVLWAESIGGSALLTLIILLVLEKIRG